MGKDDRIERLLVEWAQWLNVGDGSGFATMSVLHVDWTPPGSGITPTMKVSKASQAQAVHRAVKGLSQRLQDTLVVHYVQRLPLAEQAKRLECGEGTVVQRVVIAHRRLRAALFG